MRRVRPGWDPRFAAVGRGLQRIDHPVIKVATVSVTARRPGTRAVDYGLSDPYVGTVLIVPIVQDATSETQNPIVQFAYFYFTGYSAQGANGYLSGYFIDPATMPVILGPIGSGSGPGGVGGL